MHLPRYSLSQKTAPIRYLPLAAITAVLAACSPSGNPQLDMCQKIASNLIIGDAEFGEISESKGREKMTMVLPYTSDGQSGEAVCTFAADNIEGTYQTSPKAMTLDGMEIGTKDLMRASLASSKVVLKETADETKQQAAAAAEEAKVLANEAKDKAVELTDEAKVKAGEVATQIKDSEAVAKARELADETTDKAKNAIIEGAKAVQQKLEN